MTPTGSPSPRLLAQAAALLCHPMAAGDQGEGPDVSLHNGFGACVAGDEGWFIVTLTVLDEDVQNSFGSVTVLLENTAPDRLTAADFLFA